MRSWYTIRAVADGAEVTIYDEIGAFGVSAKTFLDAIGALPDEQRITLRINSPGGSVFDAVAIHNAIRRHPAGVTVWIDGIAASAASYVAMAGDEVVMPANAFLMIHDPSGMVLGTADDMRAMAEALEKIKTSLVAGYAAKSGGSEADIAELMRKETWFDAEEAVALGFVDRVAEPVRIAARFDVGRFRNAPPELVDAVQTESEPDEDEPAGEDEVAEEDDADGGAARPDAIMDADEPGDPPDPPPPVPHPSAAAIRSEAMAQRLGSHKASELETGRRAALRPGDEVILAYASRYAPDQYEAYVPDDLGECHMVAAGGIAATARSWHNRIGGPTVIEPLGLLGGANADRLSLSQFAMPLVVGPLPDHVFAVFGTSMNAGKSTTAANLVRGFSRLGHTVGCIKVTGTGAGGDLWLMKDHGAEVALDFTDAGMASTFEVPVPQILTAAMNLLRTLRAAGCTVAVVEVADGLLQRETAGVAESEAFRDILSGVFFAANDALGAISGAARLEGLGHGLIGVCGSFTRAPLAIREAMQFDLPVFTIEALSEGEPIRHALEWSRHHGEPALDSAMECGETPRTAHTALVPPKIDIGRLASRRTDAFTSRRRPPPIT